MRRASAAVVIALAAGCHKDAAPEASAGSAAATPVVAKAPPDAAVADASAVAPPMIELLHAVPAMVRVSSTVANTTITPEQIVDHDLNTAWNSATGELANAAWVEVTIPGPATFAELRLTVGHTGKGPKGEDYFTMNPRIKKVTVYRDDGRVLGTFPLDVEKRDLQTIKVATPGGTLRIGVDEIVPGSKKSWRETAISELEVWGTPPPGWTPPKTPLVPRIEVGDPSVGTEESLEALCEARLAEPMKSYKEYANTSMTVDGDEAPRCMQEAAKVKPLAVPWTGVGTVCLESQHSPITGHGSFACSIALATDDRWWVGREIESPEEPQDAPRGYSFGLEVFDAYVVNLPDPQLVVRFRTSDPSIDDRFTVCRTKPKRGCSEPITSSRGDVWKTKPKQDGTDLVMVEDSGDPPDDELGIVTKQLKF